MPLHLAVAAAPFGVPVDIDREPAQRLARLELAKPEYRADDQSLVGRVVSWVSDRINDLLDAAGRTSPQAWLGLLVVALLLVLVVVAVRRRTGALSRSAAVPLFDGRVRSAADHRRDAEALARSGAWAEAVRERLRAAVRELEERGVLDPQPGRTADEIAREAGRSLPSAADALRDGTRLFDDVWYGGRTADAAAYARLVALDDSVAAARPGAPADPSSSLAVPR